MNSRHFYRPKDGHHLSHDPLNAIIAPRPIGWISSRSAQGVKNLAPYSFFNAFNYTPPIIGFSSIGRKDSLNNIEETGGFGWNLATRALADAMNVTCMAVPSEVDEFELSGLKAIEGTELDVPLVSESPVNFECKLSDIIQLKSAAGEKLESWLVLGEVVGVHIDTDVIQEGIFSTSLADPILRGGGPGDYFTISDEAKFIMPRPKTDA